MKIKNRLYMSAGISIILIVILVSLVLVTSGRVAEGNRKHELLDDVRVGISELDILTYDYLLHREERMEQQWSSRYGSLREILEKSVEEKELISIRADYTALGDLFSQVTANSEEIQKLTQEGASQERIDNAIGLEERLVAHLLITSHSIFTGASILAEGALAEVRTFQRLSTILTSALMIILAITVTTSSLLVARSISKPLDELTKGTEIIGKGDLEHKVEIKTRDELGDLATAFNQMATNLKETTASRDELNKEVVERKKVEKELKKHQEHLEELVEERTAELKKINKQLEDEITEHKKVEEELKKHREHLEEMVASRTAQLEVSNRELESFAYSVSHDLRTPLRSIDGFSRVLLEEYSDKVNEQGKHYLQKVCSASQRMAQLIDDMLQLSHVTRQEMKKQKIDLTALAGKITRELQQANPEHEVEFIIKKGLVANGDFHLIRQVMENLLGNAMKFTGKNPQAKIEFGVQKHKDKQAFFVRDNGVGFEMEYVDKLFGAFQRLHSAEDFPGTGIGLATVKRIISRHGGQIWAEGKVDKGATFYFTL